MIHPKFERSLAGLQVGMFGGGVMLAVLMLVSELDRRGWWSFPNLLAACFYGPRTIGGGPGWPTVAGIALQLLIAGVAGILFGSIFGGLGSSRRIAFLGLMWGVLVFYGSEQLYRTASPIIAVYIPRSASIVAHMIYGVCLAGIGRIGGVGYQNPGPSGEVVARGTPVAVSAERGTHTASASVHDRSELASGEIQIEDAVTKEPAKSDVESQG